MQIFLVTLKHTPETRCCNRLLGSIVSRARSFSRLTRRVWQVLPLETKDNERERCERREKVWGLVNRVSLKILDPPIVLEHKLFHLREREVYFRNGQNLQIDQSGRNYVIVVFCSIYVELVLNEYFREIHIL